MQKQYEFLIKKPNLSVNLMKLIGLHIQYGLTHDKKNIGLQIVD